MWLSWGSGYVFTWSDPEIFEIRLNKGTGLRADNTLHAVSNGHEEASYIYYHNNYYYLFWNTGGCCSGTASSYLIHVARSTVVTGPYVGTSGAQDSSNTFLASHGDVHGPAKLGYWMRVAPLTTRITTTMRVVSPFLAKVYSTGVRVGGRSPTNFINEIDRVRAS
jgi:hypothetical protein